MYNCVLLIMNLLYSMPYCSDLFDVSLNDMFDFSECIGQVQPTDNITAARQLTNTVLRGAFEETWVSLPPPICIPCHFNPAPLTALTAVHVDLRTLLRRNDSLRFPRPRGSDTVELALQHRSGFGDSGVAPGRGRGPQDDPGRPHQTPDSFPERHDCDSVCSRYQTCSRAERRDQGARRGCVTQQV